MKKWYSKNIIFYCFIIIILLFQINTVSGQAAQSGDRGFNYAEALQKSIMFYEAQRSGHLDVPGNPNRFTWRGDSQLEDGFAQGVDLTGGWVDAGDNVKFGFPMAGTANVLAWIALECEDVLKEYGQYNWLLNQLKWVNDYFIKCHTAPNEFWHQVGATEIDHGFWGPIESTQYYCDRTAFKVDTANPGTEVTAETAAAMAAASIVYKEIDPTYSSELLNHAVDLYAFADNYQHDYYLSNPDPGAAYKSYSGYMDELVWGALWLYKATGDGVYLDKAVEYYPSMGTDESGLYAKYIWTHNWDDKAYGSYILMSQIFPDNPTYKEDVERWLDYWTIGFNGEKITYTPGGHAYCDEWGSLRLAANAAYCAFIYAKDLIDPVKKERYIQFAETQINYILGDNPRSSSYICGFGNNPPEHPHHRTAHGSWDKRMMNPPVHRHILYGALVGSPSLSDGFIDDINDYKGNEVACDYNSGLVGALAFMTERYGGTTIPDNLFPLPDKDHELRDEFAVFATVYSDHKYGFKISTSCENRSAWPAQALNEMKFRYFFTLDAPDISDIVPGGGSSASISGPFLWNAEENVYYVELDFSGIWIAPGYTFDYGGPQCDFNLDSVSGSWDSSNDFSFHNWDSEYSNMNRNYASRIPVYNGDVLLSGEEPPLGITTPTETPTPDPAPTPVIGLLGDVNNDRIVNIIDALLTAQYYVGLDPSGFNQDMADVNCDINVNIVDSLLIAQFYVGLITIFCP